MSRAYQTSYVAAIVAILFLMAMVVLGLGVSGRLDDKSTPLILSIFGTAATVIVTLLNIIRTDRAVLEVKQTNGGVRELKHDVAALQVNSSPHPEGSHPPIG